MRNLTLIAERHRSASLAESLSDQTQTGVVCADLCRVPNEDGPRDEDDIVLLAQHGTLVRVNATADVVWAVNLNDKCDNKRGDWFDVTFVGPEIVCLSKGGAIVTVSPSTGACELVGEFDHGLEAGKWSPDREVLFLVTLVDGETDEVNSVLLSMNAQLEVLAEVPIESHLLPTAVEKVGDTAVSMAWKPDGTMCAISTVDKLDNIRRIRVYSRDELALKSIGRSEDGSGKDVPNLQSVLAWAGGGCSNLITSIQQKGRKTQQVVFFEPNGLRHREFPLRADEADYGSVDLLPTLLGIAWNAESDLLAVILRDTNGDKVQLWHRSNYHWYLKQEFRYQNKLISCVRFDDEKPYALYASIQSSSKEVQWIEYSFCWDASSIYVPVVQSKTCTAISIDGCNLNMTPFDKALVPPPMYAMTLTMPRPIREVAFVQREDHHLMAAIFLSNGCFVLLGGRPETKCGLLANHTCPSILGTARWTDTQDIQISSLRQLKVVSTSESALDIIAVAPAVCNGHSERLVEMSIRWDQDSQKAYTASITNGTRLEGRVLRVINWSDREVGALFELDDGTLLEYERGESGQSRVLPSAAEPLLEPCPWIAALHDARMNGDDAHSERLVVGRSLRGRLYCHDRLLADSSSSFILSPAHSFLCYVTADARCQLRSLPLTELHGFDPLMGSDENHMLEGYEPRNVERGARLVAILPMAPTAVLQMPRGNIEGIYPRSLVLPYVVHKIHSGEYGEAFVMMRKQKVDLNLIVDIDPVHFLDKGGLENFVEQTTVIDHLNLFISCLQNIDVTQLRYRIPTWLEHKREEQRAYVYGQLGKVNMVCRYIRGILLSAEEEGRTTDGKEISRGHYLLPILSTFAKENPPRLEDALGLIKNNALEAHPPSNRKPPLFSERAQSSIHYLAFLADYKLLFDTALGMYDYDLARAVARNSQMDPKVYLPLLKHLRALPVHYGKYEVDMRLKRYDAALSNLVMSRSNGEVLDDGPPLDDTIPYGNDFETCMTLIKQQQLHKQALRLFQNEPDNLRNIMVSLGQNLLENQQFETSLLVFLAASPPDYEGAKRAARGCGDWRYFFSAFSRDNGEDDILRVALTIADEMASEQGSLAERRRSLSDAARMLLDYCEDTVGAVDMLIKAEMWSEAHRVASMHSRQDLVKRCTDAAVSFAHTSIEDLESRKSSFLENNSRYIDVLVIRKAAIRESDMPAGEYFEATVDDNGSLFSMGSSASNASVRSDTSGSSVGSVSSVSSVITVGAQSSFSLTGDDVNKHKSKFNKLGKQKKKKKSKRERNRRTMPGSEEELRSLVASMKAICIDDEFCRVFGDTVKYLAQVGRLDVARLMFDCYIKTTAAIHGAQYIRIMRAAREKEEADQRARKEGIGEEYVEHVEHPVEKDVNSLRCPELPSSLHELFSILPF